MIAGMSLSVKLEAFDGPLDLLLHLIEKNKIDIFDIPIVEITEQYMDYVSRMETKDMDVMSDFLVMAATLLKIKSKMLLPAPPTEEGEEEDPRAELVERLLQYKMYKYAASELKDLELDGAKAFYKKESIPAEVKNFKPVVDPVALISEYDMNLEKLNEIFKSVMRKQVEKVDPIRSKFKNIEREEISLEAKMAEVREQVRGLAGINFRTLLEMQASRSNIIVTFLAILELMKIGAIQIQQEEIFGEIIIDSRDDIAAYELNSQNTDTDKTDADVPDSIETNAETIHQADGEANETERG